MMLLTRLFFLLLYFLLEKHTAESDIKEFFHYLFAFFCAIRLWQFGKRMKTRKEKEMKLLNLLSMKIGYAVVWWSERESETWNCFYLKRLSDIREHHQRLNCCFAVLGGGDFYIISLSLDYSSFSWYSFSDHEKIYENKKKEQ